jgi:hypothetical protein
MGGDLLTVAIVKAAIYYRMESFSAPIKCLDAEGNKSYVILT